ncbi:MAG: hypothetical protein ACUVXD_13435 [Thermodesulfobacteriota bacterium]
MSRAIQLEAACIGLIVAVAGGYVLSLSLIITRRWVQPYIRHVLGFIAPAIGLAFVFMLVSQMLAT